MRDLSITQEYLIYAMHGKERFQDSMWKNWCV